MYDAAMSNIRHSRWAVPALLSAALLYFALNLWQKLGDSFAWDFGVDWTASQGMRQGISLYDPARLGALAQQLIADPQTQALFSREFAGYINPPSTALLLLPFTLLSFAAALATYRLVLLIVFAAGVALAGLALPPGERRRGWLLGALGLLLLRPVIVSIQLGQVDAWVMLGLGAALWTTARQRWIATGVGLGWAAAFKVSPALLVVYLALRGQWRAIVGAGVAGVGVFGLAAALGRPTDLGLFLFGILPSAAKGTLYVYNQSLPAWLARLLSPETNLIDSRISLGPWQYASVPLLLLGLGAVWLVARRAPQHPLTLSLLIPVAILTGPVAWDHYLTWMILPLVQMADRRAWQNMDGRWQTALMGLLVLGGVLMSIAGLVLSRTILAQPEAVAAHWWWRPASGLGTVGALLWFAVGLILLARLAAAVPVGGERADRVL